MGWRLATVLGSMVCAAACSSARAEGLSPAEQEVAADPDGVYALETAATTADELEPLESSFRVRPRKRPDWWREYSDDELPTEEPVLERERVHLVLQEDRADGPDMLTLRYPFVTLGPCDVYAGAGLGQVVYLAENGIGPMLLFGRAERHRSVRPAAELGTELRFGHAAFVTADFRWLDLDDDASVLRTESGMIDAASWASRVTIGWRFR